MRKTVLAAVTTTLLAVGLLSPPSAQAAAAAYVVTGHPLTSAPGLGLSSFFCYDGAQQAQVTSLERQGGTVGAGALGWQASPAGVALGPRATMAGDPTTLNRFKVDVLAPSGTTGWVRVYFEDNGDGDDFSTNEGWAEVAIPASGSWQTLDVTNWTYDWEWVLNGVDQGLRSATVQSFAGDSGYIASAQYDVLLGCNGQPFHLDAMAVSHNTDSVTYDFEPKPAPAPPPPPPPHPMAHLEWLASRGAVQTSDRLSISYGQSVWMLGHSHLHTASGNEWYSGFGTMAEQPVDGPLRDLGRKGFTPDYYAAYKVSPTEETVYRFTADATGGVPATSSNFVTVFVSSKVRASVIDRHLVQGQRLGVKGKVWPTKRGVKVALQRKVGGKWKRLASGKTRKGGSFRLSTVAKTPGRWKVRVQVFATNTNLGTSTRSAKVTVDRYVPPRKNQPPPPPPVDSTPEQPAQVTTPEPEQTTTTAPTPPDRPTNTGRTLVLLVAGAAGAPGPADRTRPKH
jgi:hypothetical protein